jgi:hypothetical protein
MIRVNQIAGSANSRNFTFQVTGVLTEEMPLTPIDLGMANLRLASLVWIVQEKLGLYLWWDDNTDILPMESRNTVRFDASIPAPEKWDGRIWLSSFGFVKPKKTFFLVMDFDK